MRHLWKALLLSATLLTWVLWATACNSTVDSTGGCTGPACSALTAVCAKALACSGAACPPAPPPFNPAPSAEVCEAQNRLAKKLGTNRLLLGIMTEGAEENYERYIRGVPYGLKYIYLPERARAGGPCTDCNNCPNQPQGGWWGCWNRTGNDSRPGARLRNLFSSSEAAGQIPMVVYYTFYRTIGEGAGALERGVLNDTNNVRDYFRDWRFTLQVVNEYQQQNNKPVWVHIEPDLWGFAQQSSVGRNGPERLPVQVQEAAEGDCPTEENNFAGFGKCMLRMARHHAPQASIGLMASGWATGLGDINLGRGPNARLDAVALGKSTGEYLNKFRWGEDLGDFVVVEFSDRDAGFYAVSQNQADRWYDANNTEVPHFHRTFLWGKTLADTVKLPLVWWQIPMGHMGMNNTPRHWCDNRVDYLFEHLDEVAASQSIALAFGPGSGDQTTPATDGGNLANKVRAYAAGPGQKLICAP